MRPNIKPTAKPTAKPAAKAAPVDEFDGFGDDTGFDGFGEEDATAGAESDEFGTDFDGFADAEDGVEAPGGDEFDGFGDETATAEGDEFEGFEPEAEAEAEVEAGPAPKLADGVYRLPKGTVAFYVEGDEAGNWVKSIKVEEAATKDLKLEFSAEQHNNVVQGLEDKPGRTFVVLGYKKEYFVVTIGEKLLDMKGKPAQLLTEEEEAVEEVVVAPVKKGGKAAAAAAVVEKKAAAPALTSAQVKAVRGLKAAYAAFETAFEGI